ncbi:MAG: beta-propeller domain-containing protein [Oscillospiraceae bacterium]|nr:beta-propeller domain-containing protein [Oscillospiraceae bacterium]
MFSKKDMLPEEELRQIKERLQVINNDFDLPKSLSAQELHKKLTPEDCREFREAGHPDFMSWQRYAGMVASFIIILAGIVMYNAGYLKFDSFVAAGDGGMAPMAAPVAEIAAMDMDEAVVEEDAIAEAEMAAPQAMETTADKKAAPSGHAPRSRLYASGYEYILEYLNREADFDAVGGNTTAEMELDPVTGGGLLSATEDGTTGLPVPDVTWQKEFTDTPGESSDILKSDGTYFYYYTAPYAVGQTGKVHIIEAETLREVAIINTGVTDGTELFIRDGRLIVVGRNRQDAAAVLYNSAVLSDSSGQPIAAELLPEAARQRAEAYGLTTISVYDLSDITQPKLVRSFMQDGVYQNCRLVGGRLFLFTRKDTTPALTAGEDAMLCDTLPVIRDSFSGNGSTVLSSKVVAIAPNANTTCYTTVSMFDVASDSAAITNSVLGASCSYLADGSIYFCYDANDGTMGIIRMTVGMDMNITSQTVLQGSLEKPFAINCYKDIIRVATVTPLEDGSDYTNVYMLDTNFQMIGSAESLGSGDAVTDIRFVGDMVYITSQRENRPVFALDLSNPNDVIILGQLDMEELPQAFRLIDGSMLIGVRNGEKQSLRLTAADVSKGWAEAKYEEKLPGASGVSDASYDYRALLYNSEHRLIGFPIICRQANGSLQNWGYAAYAVTEEGLSRQSIITHADLLNESIDLQHRSILRGRVVENRLYTFSGSMIKAHDISTMDEVETLRIH